MTASGVIITQPDQLLTAFDGDGFQRDSWGPHASRRACRLTASPSVGSGHLDYVEFHDEFITIFPRLDIHAQLPVRFADSSWVRMHFRLGGHNTTYFDREQRDMDGAFCNVLRLPEGMTATEVHSARQVGWVTVFCKADFLRREFDLDRVSLPTRVEAALAERARDLVLETCPLPAAAWRLLSELDPSTARSALGLVRCEAMVTELVCVLFDALADRSAEAPAIDARRAELLQHARRIIEADVADPPTIAELARQVGTNRTTLSRDFRAYFGRSVFDAIQNRRMQRAAELLADSGRRVGEVAQALGYSSTASFSYAFKKYYGVAPADGRRPRSTI
jgi:AraC-like DNA-binding protein